jgi:hypothetical protein
METLVERMRYTHHGLGLNLGSEILGFGGDDDAFFGLGFGLLSDRNVLDSGLAILGTLFYFCKVRTLFKSSLPVVKVRFVFFNFNLF